ncbi:hypothetical protein ACHAW6_002383 [Cyclotella cf. meneghiniana]
MKCMHTSACNDIAHSYTNSKMNPLMMPKHSSPRTMQASIIPLPKSTEQTLLNIPNLEKPFCCNDLEQIDIALNMIAHAHKTQTSLHMKH